MFHSPVLSLVHNSWSIPVYLDLCFWIVLAFVGTGCCPRAFRSCKHMRFSYFSPQLRVFLANNFPDTKTIAAMCVLPGTTLFSGPEPFQTPNTNYESKIPWVATSVGRVLVVVRHNERLHKAATQANVEPETRGKSHKGRAAGNENSAQKAQRQLTHTNSR